MVLSMLNKDEYSVAILKIYKHTKFPKLIDSKSPCLAICLISCHVFLTFLKFLIFIFNVIQCNIGRGKIFFFFKVRP